RRSRVLAVALLFRSPPRPAHPSRPFARVPPAAARPAHRDGDGGVRPSDGFPEVPRNGGRVATAVRGGAGYLLRIPSLRDGVRGRGPVGGAVPVPARGDRAELRRGPVDRLPWGDVSEPARADLGDQPHLRIVDRAELGGGGGAGRRVLRVVGGLGLRRRRG